MNTSSALPAWPTTRRSFFPVTERDKAPHNQMGTSTCIGHIGYIRLCNQEVITHSNVTKAWSELLAFGTARVKTHTSG